MCCSQDLEDTIQIVEKNPSKFRIDVNELNSRKLFIQQTREEVNKMKTRADSFAKTSLENPKYSDVSFFKDYLDWGPNLNLNVLVIFSQVQQLGYCALESKFCH